MLCLTFSLTHAEAIKEEEAEDDDDMDGFQTDDEDEDVNGSDKEMGVDAEDGDEADSMTLRKLAEQLYNHQTPPGSRTLPAHSSSIIKLSPTALPNMLSREEQRLRRKSWRSYQLQQPLKHLNVH
ncbi:hypothetical protein Ahy_Scaffold8g108542 isoform C [Arachis hypogaea]|uniref:Uncharacterized protein n=1 Tax=Arachis hypogaea TaxID=3818 RepID=A0A444WNH4_ARAHY|nr:hypothetical protein Ahy_Scaffold8g108542 isoform C [Arachis hypogaea]